MKIFYLTTAMSNEEFDRAYFLCKDKPNPSNQNFHSKLVKALSLYVPVQVISIIDDKIPTSSYKSNYFYVKKKKGLISKLTLAGKIFKAAKKLKIDSGDIVIFDSLNLYLSRASLKLKNNFPKIKRIAILTDDPSNISFASKTYKDFVKEEAKNSDASLALTEKLPSVFGLDKKPSLIFPGIVDDTSSIEPKKGKYIYYGGALFEKDGTIDLINAFTGANPSYDLIISGHGPAAKDVIDKAKENQKIIFLGQTSKEENYAYQKGALLCINPRHYNEKLDYVSVPSKVLEYLSNCDVVAATKSTSLSSLAGESINEIIFDPDDKDWLLKWFKKNKTLKNLRKNSLKSKIYEEIGLEKIGEKIQKFICELDGK